MALLKAVLVTAALFIGVTFGTHASGDHVAAGPLSVGIQKELVRLARSSDASEDICRHLRMTDKYEDIEDSVSRNFTINFKNFETQDNGLPAIRELEVQCNKNGCQYSESYTPECPRGPGAGLCGAANGRSFHCEVCHYWNEEVEKCRPIRGCRQRQQ